MPLRSEYTGIAPAAVLTRSDAQAGVGAPNKRNDNAQHSCWSDRDAAGQIGLSASLLFNHDEFSSLFHRASLRNQFGSVTAHSDLRGIV